MDRTRSSIWKKRYVWSYSKSDKGAFEHLQKNIERSQNHLSHELDSYIATRVAPECRALCDVIQQLLPRELRDMIYQYLLSQSDILIERTDFLPSTSLESSRPQLFDSPCLLDPRFCNEYMRRELFEAWYKFSTFQFTRNSLVNTFLSKDLWGLDLPVYQLVRNLEIDIWPRGCMLDTDLEYGRAEIALLACLATIRKGAKITFPIETRPHTEIWHSSEQQIQRFLQILSTIFPLARKLLGMGHRVTIEVDGSLVAHVTADELCKTAWYEKIKRKQQVR